ncbi:hypothetical protein BN1013_00367 [Candidatus Rubidus massiliensis]|mgnify:CR=1 FL=1|nr:MAG: hypothetical protein BGO10_02575 [Chlamydia sp. 32-24]CDZ79867.1 hypothetical protein BN1013_00367 [Candidatus Rubidus massiliensis]
MDWVYQFQIAGIEKQKIVNKTAPRNYNLTLGIDSFNIGKKKNPLRYNMYENVYIDLFFFAFHKNLTLML